MDVGGIEVRDIPDFPDYAVSKDGRVWSKSRRDSIDRNRSGKWRKTEILYNGYEAVRLRVNGGYARIYIHRLVLEVFVGSCPPGMEACHNNGVKTDNRLENLRWDTRSGNMQDAIQHGTYKSPPKLRGENHPMAKLTTLQVKTLRYLRKIAKFSIKDLAWHFDISTSNIKAICSGRLWKSI